MKRKLKNRILKAITWAAVITWVLAACALDSPSYAPLIVCGIDTAWLALMAAANMEG